MYLYFRPKESESLDLGLCILSSFVWASFRIWTGVSPSTSCRCTPAAGKELRRPPLETRSERPERSRLRQMHHLRSDFADPCKIPFRDLCCASTSPTLDSEFPSAHVASTRRPSKSAAWKIFTYDCSHIPPAFSWNARAGRRVKSKKLRLGR